MDDTYEPCEDFYRFTCGSYDKNNRLKEDQSKLDEFSILRDKMSYLISGNNALKFILNLII
jgi:membrane metallo-endopeptidase-like protein 1